MNYRILDQKLNSTKNNLFLVPVQRNSKPSPELLNYPFLYHQFIHLKFEKNNSLNLVKSNIM